MQAKHRDWYRTLIWSVPAVLVGLPLAMFVGSENNGNPSPAEAYPRALSADSPRKTAELPDLAQPTADQLGEAGMQYWRW